MKYLLPLLSVLLACPCVTAIHFTYTPENPDTSISINFVANTTGISAIMYVWDFGDGEYSSGSPSVYHRYKDDGNYTVTLTIVDNNSNVYQCNKTIYVNNTPPVADFTWNIEMPNPGDVIRFIDLSHDPDGYIVSWHWNISDGSKTGMQNHSHVFIDVGVYNVTLTVVDNDGGVDVKTKQIEVKENMPPEAIFVVNSDFTKVGKEITFTDASYDRDGYIVSWQWNFGDGTTSEKKVVNHSFAKPGIYNVTLTITDDDGASSHYTMKITVNGKATPDFTVIVAVIAILYHISFYRRR